MGTTRFTRLARSAREPARPLTARQPRRLLAVVVGALWVAVALAPAAASAAPASAAPAPASVSPDAGWVRLAHLSPDAPAVDVYLYRYGDNQAQVVLHHVGYGTLSPYQRVAPGEYTVAMRGVGAPAASPAVVSANVTVDPSHAYTVAGMGPASQLTLTVLPDQLSSPGGGASVRVIEASKRRPAVRVSIVGGPTLAASLRFPAATGYQDAPVGALTVRVSGDGGAVDRRVSVAAGSIHTLVVLDRPSGRLSVLDVTDAAGAAAVPAGGVDAGLGGLARDRGAAPGYPALWTTLAWSLPGLAVAAGLITLGARRRTKT